jgi:hypothetical protein
MNKGLNEKVRLPSNNNPRLSIKNAQVVEVTFLVVDTDLPQASV